MITGKNILILFCMFFLSCSELMAQAKNILENGDFETGSAKPWSNGMDPIEVTSTDVHSGTYALEIRKGGDRISQTISVRRNSRYKVSGYLKTSSGAETLELGTNKSGKRSSVAIALVSWSYAEQEFYSGPADTSVQIEIYHPGNSLSKTAWADDIKVEYLGPKSFVKQSGIKPLPGRVPVTDLGLRQQPNEKLKWLQDGKFGLFIHWGLYSGHAQGEWYMNWGKVPIAEYRKLAYPESGEEQFTANQFRPDEWAQLARDAGMKYMNLTAMHHDGFALFESKYPNAFTAKQTLGRDLVKEYINACRKAGLRVGIYKTLINWRYPGYYDIEGSASSPYFKADNKWGYKSVPGNKENARIMKEELYYQTRELMTRYGKIDQIFWDGGWLAEKNDNADAAFFWESGKYRSPDNRWPVDPTFLEVEKSTGKPMGLMGMIRKYQPDILVNPRSGWVGDYMSEEGSSPITGPVRTKEIYEKCLSVLGDAWGYEKIGEDPKELISADRLERILSDCIIRNMSLLVNVGPDRHGVIPVAEANVLREIGGWLSKVGEAVYGTRGGPWNPEDGQYGYCYNDKTIYIYIYRDYEGSTITLPSVDTRNVVRAYNVYDKKPLKFSQNNQHEITVSGIDRAQHPEVTVIAVQLDKKVY
ncbi:MAG: alpha-L-fucosidase [Ferruginibacter sp.]